MGRSVDFLALKEYTYSYREGTLIRAKEYAITVENGIIIGRTVVTTVSYTYNADGALTKKQFASGNTEWTVNYENPEEGSPIVRFVANEKTVTSRSKTDSFGRKTFEELQLGSAFISRQFAYHEGKITTEHSENDKVKSAPTTQLVSKITLSDGRTLSYTYDEEERITCVTETSENGDRPAYTTEYTYDAMGQLLTEVVNGEMVNEMTYDGYGNILTKNGKAYTYGDSVWKDKLTAIDGQPIVYDDQGNPTTYLGYALTWEKGRQLKTAEITKAIDDKTVEESRFDYAYNANGIRTGKTVFTKTIVSKEVDGETVTEETVSEATHTYTLDGTNILKESWGDNTLIPLRDNEDQVCGILYNGTPYYFLKNLQGDIIAIQNANAETVARYTYDAWGVCTITEDTTDLNIATINPFRYRGYYYDTEIGMYYLQSRYYDPAVGRFLNQDNEFAGAIIGVNLFAYCESCPVSHYDPEGKRKKVVIDPGHGGLDAGAKGTLMTTFSVGLARFYKTTWYYEKDFNLKVSLALKNYLSKAKYNVLITRNRDCYVQLDLRYKIANQFDADIFVSIHHNSANPLKKGYLTLYSGKHDTHKSQTLAYYISDALGRHTKLKKKASPARNTSLAVLNGTKMPAVLVECGYMGGDLIYCRDNYNTIAYAIYRGIMKYL